MGLLTFYGNILTELEKDVKNFAGVNLRSFKKNWYEYTKDKYILNIITNVIKLDIKKLPTQISGPANLYQAKKMKLLK